MFRHPIVIFANKTDLILHTISMLICLLTQYKYVMVDPSYIPIYGEQHCNVVDFELFLFVYRAR